MTGVEEPMQITITIDGTEVSMPVDAAGGIPVDLEKAESAPSRFRGNDTDETNVDVVSEAEPAPDRFRPSSV